MEKDLVLTTTTTMIEGIPTITNEATSAISVNPLVTFVKFILTDDKPNGNKQMVPKEEFANLIKSGIFMPLKMHLGEIKDGHSESFPIGVITQLKEEGDRILGIAALWNKERPEDIELIKTKFANKEPLNLSWEIKYTQSELNETGIEILKDTALRAVTLVGLPAYGGRTPILAVASQEKIDKILKIVSNLEISDDIKRELQAELSGISNKEEKNTEAELDEKEFNVQLDALNAKITQLTEDLRIKTEALAAKETELNSVSEEVASLKTYKADIEKKEKEVTRINEIKQKFSSVGIKKEDSYFAEKKDTLLALDEVQLDFIIQELVAFSSTIKPPPDGKKPGVPNVTNGEVAPSSPSELGRLLREELTKK
jgi:hypothetical protein